MTPQNIDENFEELEMIASKAGELNDRVGRIESELGAQTHALQGAAAVLNASIQGLGAFNASVIQGDIAAVQSEMREKTAQLGNEIGRFESAVAEIDRRAESGDDEIKSALLATAQALRTQFEAKSAEIGEWSARVEQQIAAHSVALAAIPPVLKGADAVGFNPAGDWEQGKAYKRMDVVSVSGSSYISNEDGNTEKPTVSKKYTLLARRGGSIGAGGVGGFAELTGTILPAQLVPGQSTYAVGDVLYATTTGALAKLAAGSSGQLLSTQGAGAAPIWVTATGGAGDVNGPASATDNAVVRFDGTGGKTAQNSVVIVSDTGAVSGITTLATSGAITGPSHTAPAATDLTLSGGSSGASLALGQGASGSFTFTLPGIGAANTTWVSAGAASVAFDFKRTTAVAGAGSVLAALNAYNGATRVAILEMDSDGATDSGRFDFYVKPAGGGLTQAMILKSTGNLLIGTTTDMTGSGGLKVAGTTASTSTTTGSLINAGGFGNAGAFYNGGAATFAGAVALGNTVAVGVAVASTHKVTMVIGGVTYYLLASNV